MSAGRGSSLSCCLSFLCSPTFRLERRSASTPCGCCSPQNPTTNTKLWWKRGQQRSLNRDVRSVTPKLTSLQSTPRGQQARCLCAFEPSPAHLESITGRRSSEQPIRKRPSRRYVVVKYKRLEVVLVGLGCS